MELTAPGLLLRPWRDTDAPAVLDAWRDPAIAQWNPQGDPLDLDAALRWLRWRADWSGGGHVSLAAADPADPEILLGSVSLHRIHAGDASIGYWTVAAARGRGVATAAVVLLSGWAFATSGWSGSSCATRWPTRRPAGSLRQSHRYGDGRRYDEHLHARLATD